MKVSDAVKSFLIYSSAVKGLSKNTIVAYKNDLENFCNYCNDIQVENIDQNLLDSYFSAIHDNLTSTSLGRKITTLRLFIRYLNQKKLNNNEIFLDLPKLNKYIPTVLSEEEINLLLDSITYNNEKQIRNKAMLETLYGCGLRVSELINIKISNLSLINKTLKINGKGSKERIVPLSENVTYFINLYLDRVRLLKKDLIDKDILFLNDKGKKLSRQDIYYLVDKYATKVGLTKKVHPHTFRHSFATHLVENNANIVTVQKLLGHEDIKTTQIYTHISTKKILADYDKIMSNKKERKDD